MLTYLTLLIAAYCAIRVLEMVLDRVTTEDNQKTVDTIIIFGGSAALVMIACCAIMVVKVASDATKSLGDLRNL